MGLDDGEAGAQQDTDGDDEEVIDIDHTEANDTDNQDDVEEDEHKPSSALSQGLEIAGITIGVTVTLVAVIVVAVYSRITENKR